MNEYTEDQVKNITLCSSCRKYKYKEEGMNTCQECRNKSVKYEDNKKKNDKDIPIDENINKISQKQCTACKVNRELSMFITDDGNERNSCKKCRDKNKRKDAKRITDPNSWRNTHKEEIAVYNKKYKQQTKSD